MQAVCLSLLQRSRGEVDRSRAVEEAGRGDEGGETEAVRTAETRGGEEESQGSRIWEKIIGF